MSKHTPTHMQPRACGLDVRTSAHCLHKAVLMCGLSKQATHTSRWLNTPHCTRLLTEKDCSGSSSTPNRDNTCSAAPRACNTACENGDLHGGPPSGAAHLHACLLQGAGWEQILANAIVVLPCGVGPQTSFPPLRECTSPSAVLQFPKLTASRSPLAALLWFESAACFCPSHRLHAQMYRYTRAHVCTQAHACSANMNMCTHTHLSPMVLLQGRLANLQEQWDVGLEFFHKLLHLLASKQPQATFWPGRSPFMQQCFVLLLCMKVLCALALHESALCTCSA